MAFEPLSVDFPQSSYLLDVSVGLAYPLSGLLYADLHHVYTEYVINIYYHKYIPFVIKCKTPKESQRTAFMK